MKRIQVAVGIIQNQQGDYLVGQRTVEDAYYQKWEFPGGKLEQNETAKQALKRELFEELGVDVNACTELLMLEHNYPDRHVRLFVRQVTQYSGEVRGAEGQALQWVSLEQLSQLDFLAGNQAIIECLMTG